MRISTLTVAEDYFALLAFSNSAVTTVNSFRDVLTRGDCIMTVYGTLRVPENLAG